MLLFKTFLFTIIVPGTVTLWAPLAIVPPDVWRAAAASGGWHMLGLIPIAVGVAIYMVCASDFITVGRGTPAPIDPPTALVVRGLYRFVRNPMYVGVVTLLVGETILVGAPSMAIYTVLVATGFHAAVVLYEEPKLSRSFGDAYGAYRTAVPRWIPRLTPAK